MKLGLIVGTTGVPADSATIADKADRLFTKAVNISGCTHSSDRAERVERRRDDDAVDDHERSVPRERALADAELAAKGARPFLLVNSAPYTGGDAADWWRRVASVGDIVPEVYFNAPSVMRKGVILGSADAADAPRRDRRVHGDRDSRCEARLRARLPVRTRRRRARRVTAVDHVVRIREAVLAGRETRGRGVQGGDRVVVGVGDVQPRRRGPRQAVDGVCLSLGSRLGLLRRAGCGRGWLRRITHGRPARRARQRRAVHARGAVDVPDRPLADERRHARSGRRLHDPDRPARLAWPPQGDGRPGARSRAGDHRRQLPR